MGATSPPSRAEKRRAVTAIDDASLVEDARRGARWAESQLYKRHSLAVLNTVGRLLGDKQEAFDVTQDAFIHAFDRLDQLREPAKFKAWLLRAAVMRARGVLRRRKMKRRLGFVSSPDPLLRDAIAPGNASPEVRAQLRMVFKVLTQLPVEHQLAWSLRRVEGYKLREVADIGGWSMSTTVRYVDAADARIREAVELEEQDDE